MLNKYVNFRVLLVSFLISVSLPFDGLLAQQQTPEGAHEFLRLTFDSGGVGATFDGGNGHNIVDQSWYTCRREMVFRGSELMPPQYDDVCGGTNYGTWSAPPYKAVTYKSSSLCEGMVTGNPPSYELYYQSGNTRYTRSQLKSLNRTIFWSKASDVKLQGTEVILIEGAVQYRFLLPSNDLASRTAFAMTFLKAACDPAAATGF